MTDNDNLGVQYIADDEDTDNPTEITDVTLLHPDEFADLMDECTQFQISVMLVIQNLWVNNEQCYGLAIKERLEKMYRTSEIHHGRLYPNLDTLQERDLITKDEIDDRSNSYQLTPRGKGFLKRVAEVQVGMINGEEYDVILGLK